MLAGEKTADCVIVGDKVNRGQFRSVRSMIFDLKRPQGQVMSEEGQYRHSRCVLTSSTRSGDDHRSVSFEWKILGKNVRDIIPI